MNFFSRCSLAGVVFRRKKWYNTYLILCNLLEPWRHDLTTALQILFPGYCVNFGDNKTTAAESISLQIKHNNLILSYDLPLSAASRGSNTHLLFENSFSAFNRVLLTVLRFTDNNWHTTLLYYFWSPSKTQTYGFMPISTLCRI